LLLAELSEEHRDRGVKWQLAKRVVLGKRGKVATRIAVSNSKREVEESERETEREKEKQRNRES
jgi:hypothetical protein